MFETRVGAVGTGRRGRRRRGLEPEWVCLAEGPNVEVRERVKDVSSIPRRRKVITLTEGGHSSVAT